MGGQVTGPFLRGMGLGNALALAVAMPLAAGSHAKASCPTCHSSDVKVALDTVNAVYYLCSSCRHAWSARKPVGSTMKPADRHVEQCERT
jgi:transposase-like protein